MEPQTRTQAMLSLYKDTSGDQACLPPLDEVTVYSASTSDDCDASVSSIEDLGDYKNPRPTTTRPKRSLFGSYWDRRGGAPSLHRAPLEDDDSCSTSSINTYERTLKASERLTNRRSQTALRFASDPALNLRLLDGNRQVRKTQSTSALLPGSRSRGSILRPSRYDTSSRRAAVPPEPIVPLRAQSTPEARVSFSTEVDVVVFQRPTEFWAANGWSSYYSYAN